MIFEITPKLATFCLIFVIIQSFAIDQILKLNKNWSIKACLLTILAIFYMIFINLGLFANESGIFLKSNLEMDYFAYNEPLTTDQRRDLIEKYNYHRSEVKRYYSYIVDLGWWVPDEDVINVRLILTNLTATRLPGTSNVKLCIILSNTLIEYGCSCWRNYWRIEEHINHMKYHLEQAEWYANVLNTL